MKENTARTAQPSPAQPPDAEAIQGWLSDYLARLLGISDEIDETATFQRFGLDSAAIVGLVGDLSDWLGWRVDPTIAYDHASIAALAKAVAANPRRS